MQRAADSAGWLYGMFITQPVCDQVIACMYLGKGWFLAFM